MLSETAPLTLLFLAFLAVNSYAGEALSFNRDIRPILSDKCFACHGPDGGKYGELWKGGLRLDTQEGALANLLEVKWLAKNKKRKAEKKPLIDKPQKKRFALVPGKPEHSVLIDRINSASEDDIMPPMDSDLKLTKKEKSLLERWIKEGANFDKHWAFTAPEKIKVTIPKKEKLINEIDFFVHERYKNKKLSFSKESDKLTWIRRVSLDIRGIPPSLEEVKQFKNDRSKNAYEKVVDKFLASNDYAERMTAIWLDNARYADSNAYQFDNARTMWPWRDWVLKAYMDNMPIDQFVTEQIAGDLLPGGTEAQKIASGFNRNHGYSIEGGISNEEYRTMYVNDKTTTFGTLFLALTFDCCRCHTHKYDPITIQEYYSLYAFFNNTTEKGAPGESGRTKRASAPFISVMQNSFMKGEKKLKKAVLAMVSEDSKKLRKTHVLKGGLFDQLGEEVQPSTPAVLSKFEGYKKNRLGLANWLLAKENPLFARVWVNRLWQQFFGRGLVKSSDNFGSQGDRPSHPKLLDWLAVEFRESGWDAKHIIRKIVLSRTYRQTSNFHNGVDDPENKWLSRGPSFRLSAEVLRDQVLVVSGLLNEQMGGPSVKPYQPKGIWEDLNAPRSHREVYVEDKAEKLYRKTMYTYWRRAALHPFLLTFDAPSRDVCSVKRDVTNTPLQALATQHAPVFIEASRNLSERIHREVKNKNQYIRHAFKRVLVREPNSKELRLLTKLYNSRLKHYKKSKAQVDLLLKVGQSKAADATNTESIAALSDICHSIFNLSETLTRK